MSKNKDLLDDFTNYCKEYPQLRFWQALRNWSGYSFILATNGFMKEFKDTFYFEGKDK